MKRDMSGSALLRPATPEDHPRMARILATSFVGKFALAFGRDEERRIKGFEIMLRYGLPDDCLYYVITLDGEVVGLIAFRMGNASLPPERKREYRKALGEVLGPLRAWWAIQVLSLMDGGKLPPQACYLDNLAIDPAFRRLNLTGAIADQVYGSLAAEGKTEILADFVSTNRAVEALVRREGWEYVRKSYILAPITLPLFGFAGIFRIRKDITAYAGG